MAPRPSPGDDRHPPRAGSSGGFTVRAVRRRDAAVLGPAHNRVWRAAYAGLMPPEVLAARDDAERTAAWLAIGEQHERHGVSDAGCVTSVAHDRDGNLAGWIGVGPARDEMPPAAQELWALYVVPECWRRGVAAQLVRTCLPVGPAYLWVLAGNERAIAFYTTVGFALDGVDTWDERIAARELRMTRP